MFGLGFWEIALILAVALILLGPKKLPEVARSLGKGLRELRRASEDLRSTIEEPLEEVRKPLREIKDELVHTVYNVEQEIRKEADAPADDALIEQEQIGKPLLYRSYDSPEGKSRQQEVEELYTNAALDDGSSIASEPIASAEELPQPQPAQDQITRAREMKAKAGENE